MAKRLKLFGITYLVGKISRSNFFFQGPLAEWVKARWPWLRTKSPQRVAFQALNMGFGCEASVLHWYHQLGKFAVGIKSPFIHILAQRRGRSLSPSEFQFIQWNLCFFDSLHRILPHLCCWRVAVSTHHFFLEQRFYFLLRSRNLIFRLGFRPLLGPSWWPWGQLQFPCSGDAALWLDRFMPLRHWGCHP